jgi:hypothetical protein
VKIFLDVLVSEVVFHEAVNAKSFEMGMIMEMGNFESFDRWKDVCAYIQISSYGHTSRHIFIWAYIKTYLRICELYI